MKLPANKYMVRTRFLHDSPWQIRYVTTDRETAINEAVQWAADAPYLSVDIVTIPPMGET